MLRSKNVMKPEERQYEGGAVVPIEPQEDPLIRSGQPSEPPQESPPGNPRPEGRRRCRSPANRRGRKNCQEARQMNRRCGDRVDRVRLRLQPTPGSAICPVKGQIWIRVPADMPQGTM